MPQVLPVVVTCTFEPGTNAMEVWRTAQSIGGLVKCEVDFGYSPLPPGYYADIEAGKPVDLYAYRDEALREAQAPAAPAA